MLGNTKSEGPPENQRSTLPGKGGPKARKGSWFKYHLAQLLALTFALLLLALIAVFRNQIIALGGYGYLGVFAVSMLGSATIVVPIPGLGLVFTLGGTLNPLLLGAVSGVGAALGETTGYLLGYGGRAAIENMRLYRRIEGWMKRWGPAAIFVLAVIPNPVFDVAGAVAGASRFPLWKFLIYAGAGQIVKHTFVAFAGAWGMKSLLHFLG